MFKITRDGELDIEENFGKSYAEKIMNMSETEFSQIQLD